MKKKRKSTPEDQHVIKDDNAPWEERAAAVLNVAVDHLEYLEPDIAHLLDHEEPELRGEALSALLYHWKKEAYLPAAFKMLAKDPNEFARGWAAFALAGYLMTTALCREKILRALARAVHSDPAPQVVRDAYVGLVEILAPDRRTSTIPDDIVRERDIDWKLLQPYLPN